MFEVVEENKKNMTRTNDDITLLMSDYTTVSRKLYTLKNLAYIAYYFAYFFWAVLWKKRAAFKFILCFLKLIKSLHMLLKSGEQLFF